jgi:phospholipid transport system substrate-binding protein
MHSAKSCLSIAAFALALIGPGALRAADGVETMAGARAFVEDLGRRTTAVLAVASEDERAHHQNLKALVREGFDLELMGRFVLGSFWRAADADQRAEFQDLFAEHLLNSYARRLDRYRSETLAVLASRPIGTTDVMVETRMNSVEGPIVTGWRVRPGADGHRIVDVTVNGISLALTERQEIGSAAKALGIDGLLKVMRANAQGRAAQGPLASGLPDTSAKAWMLVSFLGSSGSPLEVALARR